MNLLSHFPFFSPPPLTITISVVGNFFSVVGKKNAGLFFGMYPIQSLCETNVSFYIYLLLQPKHEKKKEKKK